jgi:hypothetical protein
MAISAMSSAAPDDALLRIDGVRQPGIGRPRPPERGQHERATADPGERRVVGEQYRDLREREHEDEIEEELARRNSVFVLERRRGHPSPRRDDVRARLRRHPGGDLVLPHGRTLTGGVAGRHRVESLVAAPVVVLVFEEQDHERLLGFRVMKHDDLLRGDVVRAIATLHLLLHLSHAVAADAIEGHNSCKRHHYLLVGTSYDSKASPRAAPDPPSSFRLSRLTRPSSL